MPIDPFLAPPHLLEVAHVAHRLCTNPRYVWKLIATGELPAIRLGKRWRIDPDDLKAYVKAKRVQIAQQERRIDQLFQTSTARIDDLQARRRERTDATSKAAG